jgi:maleate isomerase
MYGFRARIGYTSPPLASEIFPYEFYKIVPEGVTLVIATLDVWDHTTAEIQDSFGRSMRAARAMGEAGVDLIVLGGVPVLASQGLEKVDELVGTVERECGVPATTALHAYNHALRRLKARKVAVVEAPHTPGNNFLQHSGFNVVGSKGSGDGKMVASTRSSSEETMQVAREVLRAHPEADTVYISWPHRATVDRIEALERELKVNVVSGTQAIIWHALRRCGVTDPIPGYGRLLREPGAD